MAERQTSVADSSRARSAGAELGELERLRRGGSGDTLLSYVDTEEMAFLAQPAPPSSGSGRILTERPVDGSCYGERFVLW